MIEARGAPASNEIPVDILEPESAVPELLRELVVPGGHGGALPAQPSPLITIVDVKGHQARSSRAGALLFAQAGQRGAAAQLDASPSLQCSSTLGDCRRMPFVPLCERLVAVFQSAEPLDGGGIIDAAKDQGEVGCRLGRG